MVQDMVQDMVTNELPLDIIHVKPIEQIIEKNVKIERYS